MPGTTTPTIEEVALKVEGRVALTLNATPRGLI